MITLNKTNEANIHVLKVIGDESVRPVVNFMPINAVFMGIAYGGEVEEAAKILKGKGTVYGYDTFEGHPKELCKGDNPFEKECMDYWYKMYGMEDLKYENQRAALDKQGLTNAVLVKGLINKDSCKDLDHIDVAFLDLDILESMQIGYEAIKEKMIPGSILMLHDVVPEHHIPRLNKWYKEEILEKGWNLVEEVSKSFLVILKKGD